MPLWDRVKNELDRAGRAAQDAIDEGKVRLEAFRARQLADRAAQALGYAVYRARKSGGDIDPESYDRLAATLATHEETASRLEEQMDSIQSRRGGKSAGDAAADAPETADAPAPEPPGAAAGAEAPPSAARPSADVPPMA
jgi:hypothetical protein